MLFLTAALLLESSLTEAPDEVWRCRNQIEVWCAADSCAASPPNEFTPLSVTAHTGGELSVCAYTGCWQGDAPPVRWNGRALWTGDDLPFSSSPDGGMQTDVTLLIVEADGVGFVRAAGLATPLLCTRKREDLNESQ